MVDRFDQSGTDVRLLDQYRESAKLKALLRSVIDNPGQNVRDVLEQLRGRLDIDAMSGVQLDRIGDIIGRPRPFVLDFAESGDAFEFTELQFAAASGGTVADISDPDSGLLYTSSTFTNDGTFTVTEQGEFEYLILGGGASGATAPRNRGAGGGAAGTARQGVITLTPGTYPITVGPGGAAQTTADSDGNAGGDSSALGITAPGGEGGKRAEATGGPGGTGGSNADFNGGAADPDTGRSAGGGAGSDQNGRAYDHPTDPMRGGDGISSGISGTNTDYGGGGGGVADSQGSADGGVGGGTAGQESVANSADAPANSGSGTGGALASIDTTYASGAAGSGIVIIRWRRAA